MLITGDKACTSGLSKRVYDTLCAVWLSDMGYDLTAQSAANQQAWKLLSYSVAKGVVDEIQANAALSGCYTYITTSHAGLQRDPATGDPTLQPLSTKTLPVTGGIS